MRGADPRIDYFLILLERSVHVLIAYLFGLVGGRDEYILFLLGTAHLSLEFTPKRVIIMESHWGGREASKARGQAGGSLPLGWTVARFFEKMDEFAICIGAWVFHTASN